MIQPILDPEYWAQRLSPVYDTDNLHHSIFRCPLEKWGRIEEKHEEILRHVIRPNDNILDCGCGYGRLLTLLPFGWSGGYLGIDISPEFVNLARHRHPEKIFNVANLLDLSGFSGGWDWAVLISVRPMVRRNLGVEIWAEMEKQIRSKASRLLYLEYDEEDEGSIE